MKKLIPLFILACSTFSTGCDIQQVVSEVINRVPATHNHQGPTGAHEVVSRPNIPGHPNSPAADTEDLGTPGETVPPRPGTVPR